MQKLDELVKARLREKESERKCPTECHGTVSGGQRNSAILAVALLFVFLLSVVLLWLWWSG
ncbi:MAG TPA: hypothetical protein VMW58_09030 [Anaerolineae bacterium]|nr:hypothetical protein [Anaerolineae bacterium]